MQLHSGAGILGMLNTTMATAREMCVEFVAYLMRVAVPHAKYLVTIVHSSGENVAMYSTCIAS